MSSLVLFLESWAAWSKMTGVDRSPWIDPLYWHGRAADVGYWALGFTIAVTWVGALCWIVYIVRASRREVAQEPDS